MAGFAEGRTRAADGALSTVVPAKINLALHVTGMRADGYHLIETLCVFTGFGDTLSVRPSDRDTFSITGPFAGALEKEQSNLVVIARDTLRRRYGETRCQAVAIHLEKNLPVSSGLGGGSSDAAAALCLLVSRWQLPAEDDELAAIGIRLGADVPMCLVAEPLIARGIGDEITPLQGFPPLSLVLVNPGVAVATRDVFANLDKRDKGPLPRLAEPRKGLSDWLDVTRNDLEAPALALAPQIGQARSLLKDNDASFARMSGSGATCFGIFDDPESAGAAAKAIAKKKPQWFVKAVETGGS